MTRIFIGLMVFGNMATFIARFIYVVDADYPRIVQTTRNVDIVTAFLSAAIAYWGMVLISP
jgi:hypothetical protein